MGMHFLAISAASLVDMDSLRQYSNSLFPTTTQGKSEGVIVQCQESKQETPLSVSSP